MTNLSPAAQAVLDAAYALPLKNGQPHLAAALRAAADQVVPIEYGLSDSYTHFERQNPTREKLLAIADELEAL